jgi:predicted NAD/FAD-binding protein
MNIAIIGGGVSGMLAAYLLCPEHEVTVFEANDYIGGHTHTVPVSCNGQTYAVDTGFIVFNDWTYPNFIKLLNRLNIASQPSSMSFSVRCEKTGLEYNGTTLNTLFAQRRNLFRLSFHRMWRDILRFNRTAKALLQKTDHSATLGDYLATHGYSREFIEQYLIPMGASIWSAEPRQIYQFPVRSFVQFFHNHGMLTVNRRPQWRTVTGGSQRYAEALTRPYRDRIRLSCPIRGIIRRADHVTVIPHPGEPECFDAVIIATHSDQALALLTDATPQEQEVLSAISYQENDVVLHTDESLLPQNRLAWAGWNYYLPRDEAARVIVTYNLNILQNLRAPRTFCLTLNRTNAIDPTKILRRMTYHHPVYTQAAVAAQQRHDSLNGVNRTYFCGAYWGYGFHEDGVNSALAVCKHFGKSL